MKRFFEKLSRDRRFKKAGPGQRLGDAEEHAQARIRKQEALAASGPADSKRPRPASSSAAAQAALARLERKNQPKPKKSALELERDAARAAAKREAEIAQAMALKKPTPVDVDAVVNSQRRVRFVCPICGEKWQTKAIREHIITCLQDLQEDQPLEASAMLIHTASKSTEITDRCTKTISTYLQNVIANPSEGKYRKIRLGNKAFQERVAAILGSVGFLKAIGFEEKTEDGEVFLVLPSDVPIDTLTQAKEILGTFTKVEGKLDRNMQVLPPSSEAPASISLPSDFFEVTVDDVKLQKQYLEAKKEQEMSLRTQAMRVADRQKEKRNYKFMILRVRFPDGFILEGTFKARETMATAYAHVREKLIDSERPFKLHSHPGRQTIPDDTTTLSVAGLVPAAIVNFAWEGNFSDPYLSEEVLATAFD